ncbi:MAG: coproporphyrinogen III oxidase [Sphingobium sp.]|nr:coproporphyrinogen III oxidase [Sphingobium sp.]
MLPGADKMLALYIHWPFCVSKCPYCDFNSHVRDGVDTSLWRASLLADMAHERHRTGPRTLSSIFFGGGTPSLMPPALVADLIDAAQSHWAFAPDIEITLEANPNSVEVDRFADLAIAGVNRVSLGVQSFDGEALRFLGRAHDVGEAQRAIEVAQSHFRRVSFDLIYALPDQSAMDWEKQLHHALSFGTDHLSLYQLTIEAGTRFETLVRQGRFIPAEADHGADLYDITQELTKNAGIPAYETSNHARLGQESRHNLTYWRYGDYAGIGPGAHGRRPDESGAPVATQRHKKPENWLDAVGRNGYGLQSETGLSPQDRGREALLMGLRLGEGVDLDAISARTGLSRTELVDDDAIKTLSGYGLLKKEGTRLQVTEQGALLLDAILGEIVL